MEGEGWRAVGIERTMDIERAMGIEKAGFCGLFGSTERSVFPAWGGEEEEKGEERKEEDSIEELERAKPGVVGKLTERLEIATRGIRKTCRKSINQERNQCWPRQLREDPTCFVLSSTKETCCRGELAHWLTVGKAQPTTHSQLPDHSLTRSRPSLGLLWSGSQ